MIATIKMSDTIQQKVDLTLQSTKSKHNLTKNGRKVLK